MKFKKWIPGIMLGAMMAVMTAVPVLAGNPMTKGQFQMFPSVRQNQVRIHLVILSLIMEMD